CSQHLLPNRSLRTALDLPRRRTDVPENDRSARTGPAARGPPVRVTDLLLPAVRQFRTQRLQALLIAVAIALGVGVVVAVAAQVQTAARLAASLQESLMARELSIRSTADGPRTF